MALPSSWLKSKLSRKYVRSREQAEQLFSWLRIQDWVCPRRTSVVLVSSPVWAPNQTVTFSRHFDSCSQKKRGGHACWYEQNVQHLQLICHVEPVISLYSDGESFVFYFCCLLGRYDLMRCGYGADHASISVAFARRWLRCIRGIRWW
jgi:hypothetical protein